MPLVSILIPCFNAERWIAQCIDSALAQTWADKEVIVVDDGSTDGSLQVIQSFGDHIRWETGPNHGGNAARNRLLELAGGEWVQYLDADDYLLPEKVERQMDTLKQNPNAAVFYGPVLVQHEHGPGSIPVANPHPINKDDVWIGLVRWHLTQTGGFLYRRQALQDVGGWKPEQPCCQDNELSFRLLKAGHRFTCCAHAGAVYRLWDAASVSSRNRRLVRHHRLEIIDAAEQHLRNTAQLTPERLQAVNQARFELARVAWCSERAASWDIFRAIQRSQPGFHPAWPVPVSYRLVYRLFGFRLAETIAAGLRKLARQTQISKTKQDCT